MKALVPCVGASPAAKMIRVAPHLRKNRSSLQLNRARPPVINGVPPPLGRSPSNRPSIRQSGPPSLHPSFGQVSDWSGHGATSCKYSPLMVDSAVGQGETHTHTQAFSASTRLLVGFTESCICILASRRMHMQMATMLIVIKGHLRRHSSRLLTCSHSPSTLFCSLSPSSSSLAPVSPACPPHVFRTVSVGAFPLSQSPRTAEHGRFSPRRVNKLPSKRAGCAAQAMHAKGPGSVRLMSG